MLARRRSRPQDTLAAAAAQVTRLPDGAARSPCSATSTPAPPTAPTWPRSSPAAPWPRRSPAPADYRVLIAENSHQVHTIIGTGGMTLWAHRPAADPPRGPAAADGPRPVRRRRHARRARCTRSSSAAPLAHARDHRHRRHRGPRGGRRRRRLHRRRPGGAGRRPAARRRGPAAGRAEPRVPGARRRQGAVGRPAGRPGRSPTRRSAPPTPPSSSTSTTTSCPRSPPCWTPPPPAAPLVHAGAASNVAFRKRLTAGDADGAFARAAYRVRQRMTSQRIAPVALEPRGVLAYPARRRPA